MDSHIAGALTFCSEIGDAVAHEFRQLTHSEIVFVAAGRVAASTLSEPNQSQEFTELFAKSAPSRIENLRLGDEHFLLGRPASRR